MLRRALVSNVASLSALQRMLESTNYYVTGALGGGEYIIEGNDVAGWTLDEYVIPRLASGLMQTKEARPIIFATSRPTPLDVPFTCR